ncbi:MAG: hypothetical protein ACYCWK_04375 [Cuniculiplasma sp.]
MGTLNVKVWQIPWLQCLAINKQKLQPGLRILRFPRMAIYPEPCLDMVMRAKDVESMLNWKIKKK